MYSAYKLNKQGDNIQPWCTPFPIWNPCSVLTVALWPAYRFLRRQVRWSGIPISLRIFHSSLWSTGSKAFTKSMKQIIFWNSLSFFYDLTDVGNLISGYSVSSKPSLYIWKSLVHVLMKPSLKDFEHNLASMWDEHNCTVAWTYFGIALLWDWNENWLSPVLWPVLSFPNLLTYWVQHFNSSIS